MSTSWIIQELKPAVLSTYVLKHLYRKLLKQAFLKVTSTYELNYETFIEIVRSQSG